MAEYYYNMTKFVPEENRNYNPTMRAGYRTYNQYETLTRIYKDFSCIIERNGKIVEDDLKNVYSKYDKELRDTELYSSSLYSPNNNVYYYISSLPFKEFEVKGVRIEITCIYCNEKYTPTLRSFEQKMCFCLYKKYKVNERISFLKTTDELYLNHNTENKCIGNTTYFIRDIVNEPLDVHFVRPCYMLECRLCHKVELKGWSYRYTS